MVEWALTIALIIAAGVIGWLVGSHGKSRLSERMSSAESELKGLKEQAAHLDQINATLRDQLADAQNQASLAQGRLSEIERMREESQKHALSLTEELERLRQQCNQAESAKQAHEARLAEMRNNIEEQKVLLNQARDTLSAAFKSLAADVLKGSSEEFLKLAGERMDSLHKQAAADFENRQRNIEEVINPMRESLGRLDLELHRLDEERRSAQAQLAEHLQMLTSKTQRLADALSRPTVRGRWGEIQLRNVVETAGMVDHCDFREQAEIASADGRLRPDMTINLPGGRTIVVDSKVPLQAYLEALELTDGEQRAARLADHARHVRHYIEQLSSKAYWDLFDSAPEFVILFLPGEMLFSSALQYDPTLIEEGAKRKVILATPTTLIALLKAVAYGWRHEQLAQNARRISDLGQELHDRIATMAEYMASLGNSLSQSVNHYNKAVGSFEQRVLLAARRFKEFGAEGKKEIKQLDQIENSVRQLAPSSVEAELKVEAQVSVRSEPD
jgi:DNA recombination protein RmuC